PLAGDELRLDVQVSAGVRLVLRSVAATVALPGHGRRPSTTAVTAQVGDDAVLDYLPEPTVAAAGCRHRSVAEVQLGTGACLRWREEVLLGRFDEPAGAAWASLRVDAPAPSRATPVDAVDAVVGRLRPLLRQELDLAPDAPGLHGPAVLGGARAIG
nr:urease accessory protein UreD [Micromonospora sp. DSM 115978]